MTDHLSRGGWRQLRHKFTKTIHKLSRQWPELGHYGPKNFMLSACVPIFRYDRTWHIRDKIRVRFFILWCLKCGESRHQPHHIADVRYWNKQTFRRDNSSATGRHARDTFSDHQSPSPSRTRPQQTPISKPPTGSFRYTFSRGF